MVVSSSAARYSFFCCCCSLLPPVCIFYLIPDCTVWKSQCLIKGRVFYHEFLCTTRDCSSLPRHVTISSAAGELGCEGKKVCRRRSRIRSSVKHGSASSCRSGASSLLVLPFFCWLAPRFSGY